MRILLVDLERVWRGGQEQAFLLLAGLRARGHSAELLSVRGSALAERATAQGIPLHAVSPTRPRPAAARLLRKLVRESAYDVVHANEAHALTACWFARVHTRTSVVASRRVALPLHGNPMARAQYRSAQRMIAVSHFVERALLDAGVSAKTVRVVYDGVEMPPASSDERRQRARARCGAVEGQPLIGCVGHLLPEKGQEFLLRALPQIREHSGNCRLALAGDGPCRATLERLAAELGVENAVYFAGEVADVAEIYAALDVFVFPSLAEPLGSSMLAAMAWGLPIVATNGGAAPEAIEAETSGILVPARDAATIAAEVSRLLADPQRAREFGQAARRVVQERFTADRMVAATLEIYDDVCSDQQKKFRS